MTRDQILTMREVQNLLMQARAIAQRADLVIYEDIDDVIRNAVES